MPIDLGRDIRLDALSVQECEPGLEGDKSGSSGRERGGTMEGHVLPGKSHTSGVEVVHRHVCPALQVQAGACRTLRRCS